MNKLKKFLITACAAVACVSASVVGISAVADNNVKTPGQAFDYSVSAPLKYKLSVSEQGSAKKGLLLYGYDNGATATFKSTFGGVFEAEMKAVSETGTAELRKYSLRFTDNASGEAFAIEITNGSTAYCNVETEGDRAGVVYYKDNKAYGYTAKYNEEGIYTFFDNSGSVSVKFDPASKTVSVRGDGESYKTVWDFGKKYNDGKVFAHELSAFNDYSVEVVFDEIKSAGKGELIIYSFGGFAFDGREISDTLKLNASIVVKAITGEKYTVPAASVEDIIEGKIDADVKLNVYNENGELVNDGKYEFVPQKAGKYYAYYSYTNGREEASEYCLIEAIDREDVEFDFEYSATTDFPAETGIHSKVFVPSAKVNCSLAVSEIATEASVAIYKNGEEDKTFSSRGGAYYSFDEEGDYKIVYSAPALGDFVKEEITIKASGKAEGIVADEIASIVEYGTVLNLAPTKIYVGGKELTAESIIKYPSGKTANANGAVMDELGEYILEESWNGGSRSVSFTVNATYSSLFSGTNAAFGELGYNNSYVGQTLEVSETPLIYNKLINLADNVFDDSLEDRSQNVPLVELAIQPSKAGQKDMTGLFIEFVDAHDSSNFISIRVKYQDYDKNKNRIRTKATGQTWVGYYYSYKDSGMEVHDAQSHDDGGFIGNGTFLQSLNGMIYDDSIIRFYFDYNDCALYSKPDHSNAEDGSVTPWLVRDYDTTDATLSAGQNPWRGFTNGEVYMRIYAAGISGTARISLLSVDGDKLDDKYVEDTEAPAITVELPDGNVPYACVNKPYKVFPFEAKDSYTGVNCLEPEVYFGEMKMDITDGSFVPEAEGTYTIIYKARDYYGNESVKTVEVTAKNQLDKLGLTFATDLPSHVDYGRKITVPETNGYGGAGGLNTEVAVTCNGDEIPLEYGSFRCVYEGRYLVKFTVTDYIGNKTTITKAFTVSKTDKPVLDDGVIQLPPEFFIYESYDLGNYVAYAYNSEGYKEVVSVAEVFVNGEKIETENGIVAFDETFAGKTAVVRYTFTESEGNETIYETTVSIVDPKIGYSGFMENYFISSGEANPICGANGLSFGIPYGKDGKIAFARKIDARYAKFYFDIDGASFAKGFDRFKVNLIDCEDSSISVTLSVENDSSVYWARIANGSRTAFTVEPNGSFSIIYDYESKSFVDSYGYSAGIVTNCDNGKPFNGFESGYVYASFELEGATENAVTLLQIANQNINDTSYDFIQPVITINGYVSGNYSVGSTVVLPSASAYDVLSACGKVKVSVTCGNETILRNKDASVEQSFVIEKYGVYQISYSVEADDMSGEAKVTRFVYCYDTVKPELKFNGSVSDRVKCGETVKLPDYEIFDNGDISKVSVTVYVCTPDGIMHKFTGSSFKVTGAGEYKIYYLVTDENENVNIYTFDFVAE